MLHRKIDELFNEVPNVFGIANDILVVGYDYDSTENHRTLCKALQIYGKENLKLNKEKCHFRSTSIPFVVRLFPGVT